MIKSYIRSTIIVLIQAILPIMAMLVLAPLFINNKHGQWQQSLTTHQPEFLALHGLFYLSLIFLWPKLIERLQANEITDELLKTALNARWYLLAIFLLIDIIMLIRTL